MHTVSKPLRVNRRDRMRSQAIQRILGTEWYWDVVPVSTEWPPYVVSFVSSWRRS